MAVRNDVEENLRNAVAKDPALRAQLKNNPKETLEKLFGGKLPPGTKIAVHEESANEVHIVLPAAQAGPPGTSGHRGPIPMGSWSTCGCELSCSGPTC